KGEKARALAEIVGAAVLAGEISLLAALSQGQLAQAHERLAKGVKNI
ncbi:MAG TPA: 3-hydroxy-3-methylglutaryl-CoA reductase, partial [Candidatus Dojkabacteria bacterium]|nr:3-hydroxy-3-methylglutaryl-CoA reductase [Candidatus Dojkabacteria bacterium]